MDREAGRDGIHRGAVGLLSLAIESGSAGVSEGHVAKPDLDRRGEREKGWLGYITCERCIKWAAAVGTA